MDLQLFPHRYSCSSLLLFLYIEAAVKIAIGWVYLAHKIGEGFGLGVFLNFITVSGTSVEEDIFLSRMTMHVDIHPDFALLALFEDHLFEIENLRLVLLWRLFPFSIQVHSCTWKSIISINNTIHIDHRDNLEVECFSKDFRVIIVGD